MLSTNQTKSTEFKKHRKTEGKLYTKADVRASRARHIKGQMQCIESARSARQLFTTAGETDYQNHATVLSNKHFDKHTIHTFQHPDTFDVVAVSDWLSRDYVRSVKQTNYLNADKRLQDKKQLIKFSGFNCTWDDDKIKRYADKMSEQCAKLICKQTEAMCKLFAADMFVYDHEIAPIEVDPKKPDEVEAALNRYVCPYWWRRQLRKLQSSRIEQLARDLHIISYVKQPYCSDVMFGVKIARDADNRELLEKMVAVANHGDIDEHMVDLVKAIDSSISNPAVRAAELMVRMRGCEEVAQDLGYVGEFVTWTAPSQYHSTNKNGQPNKRYIAGTTARDAQSYFTAQWKQAYALLLKYKIKPFGFRVVEPHHDVCPHWHMLLFIAPQQVARFRQVLRDKALFHNPEQVAHNPDIRIKFVAISPEKGTAAGYIAKYITKGVNGYNLDKVKDGDKVVPIQTAEAAMRIKTNLSSHGIRQFQPIGQPPVTVWRELRRLGQGIEGQRKMAYQLNDQLGIDHFEHFALENIRRAADGSDWKAFCQAMGGVQIKRNEQAARISYHIPQILNKLTGEYDKRTNRYGEQAQKRVSGVNWEKVYLCTRMSEYQLMSKAEYLATHQKIMDGVSETFGHWDKAEVYIDMAEAEFDRMLMAAEMQQSEIEKMWILAENALFGFDAPALNAPAPGEAGSGGIH